MSRPSDPAERRARATSGPGDLGVRHVFNAMEIAARIEFRALSSWKLSSPLILDKRSISCDDNGGLRSNVPVTATKSVIFPVDF